MTDCPFCEIDRERTRIIRKDKHSTIVLSNPRMMPGHSLVIPNRHVEKPWELTRDELLEIFKNIWWIEKRILAANLGTGADIRQNYRPFIPQGRVKVNHVHFHVLPRTNEDILYQVSMQMERDVFKDLSEDEETRIVELLKSD
jgi:histidine triad (HIT) family protein